MHKAIEEYELYAVECPNDPRLKEFQNRIEEGRQLNNCISDLGITRKEMERFGRHNQNASHAGIAKKAVNHKKGL